MDWDRPRNWEWYWSVQEALELEYPVLVGIVDQAEILGLDVRVAIVWVEEQEREQEREHSGAHHMEAGELEADCILD